MRLYAIPLGKEMSAPQTMGGELALDLGGLKIISLPYPEIFRTKFPNDRV